MSKNTENQSQLDFDRANRTGLSEAIYCEGKSADQIVEIANKLIKAKKAALFTRLDEEKYILIKKSLHQEFNYDAISRTMFYKAKDLNTIDDKNRTRVAVVSGGTSDIPIVREAVRTLSFNGTACLEINDVGVAGLWRIQERLKELEEMQVVICIAGMDAALPTVLGGLIPSAIIAVPTSIGYGMAENGKTALNALLVSCASGLTVVNIDNGYGAACAALRILKQLN